MKNSSESGEAKCIKSEREALLSFKEGLIDDFGMLSTWTNNTDCCKWKRILCNHQTAHVQLLDLHGNFDYTPYLRGAINITSLIHLSYIQHMDLSHNYFVTSYIPEFIGSFTNLRYLDLSNSYFSGKIPSTLGNLSQLRYLDLQDNHLSGEIPIQIGNLKHLQHLDLGAFFLSGKIPCQIGNLRQLQYLSLGSNTILYKTNTPNYISNSLSGAIPFRIGNLPLLHTLRLGGNFDIKAKDAKWLSTLDSLTILGLNSLHHLSYSHQWLQSISKLISNLSELSLINCDLLDNDVQSLFHSHLSNFSTSLNVLDLSCNMLTSSTLQLLFNFSFHLQELYLPYNNIILSSLCPNFPSLKILDLSYNNLTSTMFLANFNISSRLQMLLLRNCSLIDRSFLVSPTSTYASSLLYLALSNNLLKSCSVFHWLSNFTTSLHTLRLDYNLLEDPIPDEFGKAMNSLQNLYVSDNKLQGEVPSFFGVMCKLQRLDLSRNKFKGEFPSFIQNSSWCGRHIFRELSLSHNQITGKIPESVRLLSELQILSLEENSLEDFSCGNLTTSNLGTLDLSYNQIKGQLPDCWKFVERLLFLDLSSNQLSGKIPISMGTLVKLEALVLRNNRLMGELPFSLKNCRNLIMLDVSENMLSGPIPAWVGESMQQLIILIMRGNHFSGNLPSRLCYLKHVQLLDLSKNKLSEGIPTCLNNFTALSENSIDRTETESRVHWYNSTYYEIYNLFSGSYYMFRITWMWKGDERNFTQPELILRSIDLSCNNLTGELPKEITYLLGLVSLNLSRNNLSGEIPSEIGNLCSLESLDLSRNKFDGRIPSSLSEMDFLQILDLSHNSLSGRIPLGRHLETFDASCFEGNVGLCGEQLNKSCSGYQTFVKPQKEEVHGEYHVFYEALYMSLGIGFFTGFWGFLGPLLLWQPWRIAYLRFLNRLIDYLLVMVEVNFAKCQRYFRD
ncbi:LRR receptor-like serine/threonine-protein kinase FLS2 [Vigna unguiculata]|uniref:LRR receptor-like serine/threonine-protein kinase FLS2 n=1 Tax=Vigna unguiculata TaxID=3917 RepID=A0A4D6M3G4_VIGUN|nr:LRR receptor-like serine/threonine-protein kinase FLS2 [Vigna unguiculata]